MFFCILRVNPTPRFPHFPFLNSVPYSVWIALCWYDYPEKLKLTHPSKSKEFDQAWNTVLVKCIQDYLFPHFFLVITGMCVSVTCSVMSDSLWCHGLKPTRLFWPWDLPGKNTGVGSHFLLQGIFLTQGSKLRLLHCRWILYCLSHQGSSITEIVNINSNIKIYKEWLKRCWIRTVLFLKINFQNYRNKKTKLRENCEKLLRSLKDTALNVWGRCSVSML